MTKPLPRVTTSFTPRRSRTGSHRKGWTRVQRAVRLLFEGATLESVRRSVDLPRARVRRLALKHGLLRRSGERP